MEKQEIITQEQYDDIYSKLILHKDMEHDAAIRWLDSKFIIC